MIRWKYLVPRLAILLFLVLLVSLLCKPLTRYMIIRSAQSVTGAKVDMGTLDVSLWKGRVRVTDLQIADPARRMQNIMQVDEALFELNPAELLQRRWIVEKARLKRVQFGTPRTESGLLSKTPERPPEDVVSSRIVDFASVQMKALGQQWSDQMQAKLPGLIEENLETVRLAKELDTRWSAEFDRQKQDARVLQQRAQAIHQQFRTRSDNPLRDLERMQNAVLETRQLMIDFQSAQQKVHSLGRRFRADQLQLNQARQRDQQKMLTAVKSIDLKPQQITQLLLSEQQEAWIKDTVGWLQWFREAVPDLDKDFRPTRSRGFDVQFREYPTLLIKLAEIEGEGQLAGQQIVFGGQLNNISTTPKLVAEPMTFALRGKGNDLVNVTGIIDRRGPQDVDTIEIECPNMTSPQRVLGNSNSLVVKMQPAKLAFQLHARMQDNQLQGQIRLQQTDVKLQITEMHSVVGADNLMNSLNQQLLAVNRFDVAIDLAGTLDQPHPSLQSNLGDQFAALMSDAFQQTLQTAARKKSQQMQEILIHHVTGLDQMFAAHSSELVEMLTREVESVAELQKLARPAQLSLPRFR